MRATRHKVMTAVEWTQAPRPEAFKDCVDFIQARFEWMKRSGHVKSLNDFGKQCGFASKSFLQFVFARKRKLTSISAVKIARALGLTRQETSLFFALIGFSQETEAALKERHAQRLENLKALQTSEDLAKEKSAYLTHWYIPAIRELSSLTHFKADAAWISKQLFPAITQEQAQVAIDVLVRLEFLKPNQNGVLRAHVPEISVADQFGKDDVLMFYLQSIEMSKAALLNLPSKMREFGHLTLSLDEARFAQMKEEVAEFRRQLFKKYGSSQISDTAIFHFNLQLFPVSKFSRG
jgi:uncharacterized protein (TIGR02147 family)